MSLLLLMDDGGNVGPLDLASGGVAAYGLRRLRSGYQGPLVNVRRSSDNAQRDFPPLTSGDFPAASFADFIGGGTGAVTKWYDQTGNANDAVQPTAGNQPSIIVTASINGKGAVSFDGANGYLTLTNTLFSAFAAMGCAVVIKSSDAGTKFIFAKNDGVSQFAQMLTSGGNTVTTDLTNASSVDVGVSVTGTIMNGVAHTLGINWDGVTLTPSLDGVAGTGAALAGPLLTGATATVIGSRTAHDLKYNGLMSELIFFSSALSVASRAALQASQKTYWGTT